MKSEDEVQQLVVIEAARHGTNLLRNNSGALPNQHGTPVRYGLGNVSKKINENFKSSDQIGITPVVITPEMVGMTVGIFTAIEMKEEKWKFNAKDSHEVAQKNFLDWVLARGGIAFFCNSVETFKQSMERFRKFNVR